MSPPPDASTLPFTDSEMCSFSFQTATLHAVPSRTVTSSRSGSMASSPYRNTPPQIAWGFQTSRANMR